jgi:hypothetical protein
MTFEREEGSSSSVDKLLLTGVWRVNLRWDPETLIFLGFDIDRKDTSAKAAITSSRAQQARKYRR